MSTKQNPTKSERIERNTNISTGLRTACSKSSIPVNGEIMKAVDIAKAFDESTAAEQAVIRTRAKHSLAVKKARLAEAKVRPMIQPIKSYVTNSFGENSDVTASFGFTPRKVTKVTAEVRAEAVEKLRATRAARGTRGSRQKAAIHGQVEAPVVVAPAASPAPAPANGTDGSAQAPLLSLNGNTH